MRSFFLSILILISIFCCQNGWIRPAEPEVLARESKQIQYLYILQVTDGEYQYLQATPKNRNALEKKRPSRLTDENAENFYQWNNLAVDRLLDGQSQQGETYLQKAIQLQATEPALYWNLLRVFYLIGDYPRARQLVADFYQAVNGQKKQVLTFLQFLEENERAEERVLAIDALTQFPLFSQQAMLGLGEYFYQKQDYQRASYYFDNVLMIDAFEPNALFAMMQISYELSRWQDIILYGQALFRLEKIPPDSYYILAKAYYEKGRYSRALKILQQAAPTQKQDVFFVKLWRDTLLAQNIQADLPPLAAFEDSIPENEKLNWQHWQGSYRREMLKNLIRGY